jgi:hypothetical protein
MKQIIHRLALVFIVLCLTKVSSAFDHDGYSGRQPQLSVDKKGNVRMVFGRQDSIFLATISNGQHDFSKPAFLARVPGMHLGMTRGPQIASSAQWSLVTAMDKSGNIHSFLLNHTNGKWAKQANVNEIKSSAPEGLMSIAADDQDNFYAVWLDIRKNKHNNIFFSSFNPQSKKWSKNTLVYESPDGHVCECCKPSIAVKGNHVALMFRNWLHGSRDLYLTESFNKGKNFNAASKLGSGTWKLDGCPMDGGGIFIDEANLTHTIWQREGVVYYARPGETEKEIGKGRSCSVAGSGKKLLILMQEKGDVKYYDTSSKELISLGKGNFLKSVILPGGSTLFSWEENGEIKVKLV